MQTVTKALVGSAVAGAMALTAATPAAAQYRERDRGIDAGDQRGVSRAGRECAIPFPHGKADRTLPLVVRMLGTNVDEGKQILADSGLTITQVDTLQEAANAISEIKA